MIFLAIVVVSAAGAALVLPGMKNDRKDLVWHTVKRELLEVTIVERGTIESGNNHDIVCNVKAGNRTNSTSIKWVIPDGSFVNAGQELVQLDSSALDDQLKAQQIVVQKAENDWISADEHLKIVRSQNDSNRAKAETDIILARLELEQFLKGDYEQQRKDILSRRSLAESDVEMWLDRVAWSDRMVKKNFLSATQAQADRARLRSAQISLDKINEEERVLEKFSKVRKETELKSKFDEAVRSRGRVETEARSLEGQALKDRDTKKSVYEKELDKYRDIEEEVRKCVLRAPVDGMVVYYAPPQARWGSGSKQSIIAQSEPVSEGQKLMQIPDLKNLLVNTRVHEALVSKVRGEEFKRTGYLEAIQAGLLTSPDLATRLLSWPSISGARESEEFKWVQEKDQVMTYPGQRATVRVNSYLNRPLEGHVKSVATVAQQQDFTSDVKVYQTMVAIRDPFDGLKPGMSAEVTIHTDSRVENALTVPVQAVLRSGTGKNAKFRCWVRTSSGIEEHPVEIGLSNDRMIEIKHGLAEGDDVVLNPKALEGGRDQSDQGDGEGAATPEKKKDGKDKPKPGQGEKKKP